MGWKSIARALLAVALANINVLTAPAAAALAADCTNPNPAWTSAALVPISAGTGQVTDALCEQSQSRWYKVKIEPGQRVTAQIDQPPFPVTLALFKDIAQAADQLNNLQSPTADDIRQITASLPHDAAAPDATSPDATSPDATSPDATSPDATSPDATSPDATSPDATSPDATSPDATSADPNVPPQAYLAAQSASLLAYSSKPGTTAELVRRNTWDNTGNFFVRVRGQNGVVPSATPFTLTITVEDVDCTSGQLVHLKRSESFSLPPTPRTLIITNPGRFDGQDTGPLLTALNKFAARPEIDGYVLDVRSDPRVVADYQQWDANRGCVPAANIVVDDIHDIVMGLNKQSPGTLKYVVIAGGDKVIPFKRVPDEAGLGNERDYNPAVNPETVSEASLKYGYFLSQDVYGSLSQTQASFGDHEFPSFDIPVGRLVENVPEIRNMLSAYERAEGVIKPTTGIVTGYDFLSSAAEREFLDLTQSGVATSPLIQPENDLPSAPSAWKASALKAPLLGSDLKHYDIIDLNAHFSGNTLRAADGISRVTSKEVADVADDRFVNSLVMSMGCHSGYSIVDSEATSGTQRIDWAQAFAMKGATVIGGTGFQYGNFPFIKYSAKLLSDLTFELRVSDNGGRVAVPLGDAMVRVKRNYVRGGMNSVDEKAVGELTLYGLPMMAVEFNANRVRREATQPPSHLRKANSANLEVAEVAPSYRLEADHLDLQASKDGHTTGQVITESYLKALYRGMDAGLADVESIAGHPVVPRILTDLDIKKKVARGVVLWSAAYTDVPNFRPLVDDAAPTERRGVRPAFASSVFTPTQIVSINNFEGQTLIERPFQFRSEPANSTTGTGRRYDSIETLVYYSTRMTSSALNGPPIIYSTQLGQDRTRLTVDVAVGGATDTEIEDIVATYTSELTASEDNDLHGRWQSIKLHNQKTVTAPNGVGFVRHYTGSIETARTGATPDSVRVFIQAVGGNGLVSTATNDGAYFQLANVSQRATARAQKVATSISLLAPDTATYRTTTRVSATLTESDTHRPIPDKQVSFGLGATQAHAITGPDGTAVTDLPVLVMSSTALPQVSVGFGGDDGFAPSSQKHDLTVLALGTRLVPLPTSVVAGESTRIAILQSADTSSQLPLGYQPVVIEADGSSIRSQTDGSGHVVFDAEDFKLDDLAPGAVISVQIHYRPIGDGGRYASTDLTVSVVLTPSPTAP